MTQSITFVALNGLRRGAVADLARRDAAYAAADGADVTLVALAGDESAQPGPGVRVVRIAGPLTAVARRLRHRQLLGPARLSEALAAVPALLSAVRSDQVIVSHGGIEAALVSLLPGRARTVYRMHNFQASAAGSGRSYRAGERWVFYLSDRWAVARSNLVLAVSEGLADEVQQCTGRRPGVRRNGMTLPTNAITRATSDGHTGRDVDVLFVGRLVKEKGVAVLPVIAAGLGSEERMVVVGHGVERDTLNASLAQFAGVTMTGELPPDAVAEWMIRAKVVVIPSVHEPFGMVAVEAMASGACVVASNVGGLSEIVSHGVDGLLLPPGDPSAWAREVRRLLDEGDRRGRLARAAVGSATKHSPTLTMPILHDSYWGRSFGLVGA